MIKEPLTIYTDNAACWPEHLKATLKEHAIVLSDFVQGQPFVLSFEDGRLHLQKTDEPRLGGVCVDFLSNAVEYRRRRGGSKAEAVVKSVGKSKTSDQLTILDATAGLGRDAFVLASNGARVHMCERNPYVFLLLSDGLFRAAQDATIGEWVRANMSLDFKDSLTCRNWPSNPDVVYLDPMFAPKRKSALVKKEMRVFQALIGFDEEESGLLDWALTVATEKVVVKRTLNAPFLADTQPHATQKTRKQRFDIYLP